MKKYLSILLALVMALSMLPWAEVNAAENKTAMSTECKQESSPEIPFVDVGEKEWYYNAVVFAYQNKLFDGTSATTFEPETVMTRAMLVTVLNRLDGKEEVEYEPIFNDVAEKVWYTDAVIWAAKHDIVNGVGHSRFAPNEGVTREQIATILARYAKYKGFYEVQDADLTAFPDGEKVSVWAEEAMQWALGIKLINGSDGKLLPLEGATRAQVAKIMTRFLEETSGIEHNYQTSVVEPTCTAQGYTLTKCSYCGDATKADFKEATGHNYQDTVVPATCTEKGYTSHKCSKCNDSYKDSYTNATGHNMVPQDGGEYIYKKDGVYSSSGTKCSACGKTESGETLIRLWSDFDTELIAQYICDYAIQKYGCTRDTSLTLETGGYFPGGYAKGCNEWEVAVDSYMWVDDTFERIMYLDNMTLDEIYGWCRCNAVVRFDASGCFDIVFIYG